MSDIREMTDFREIDPVEMTGVEGGGLASSWVPPWAENLRRVVIWRTHWDPEDIPPGSSA
jgi:hypothetical protein